MLFTCMFHVSESRGRVGFLFFNVHSATPPGDLHCIHAAALQRSIHPFLWNNWGCGAARWTGTSWDQTSRQTVGTVPPRGVNLRCVEQIHSAVVRHRHHTLCHLHTHIHTHINASTDLQKWLCNMCSCI